MKKLIFIFLLPLTAFSWQLTITDPEMEKMKSQAALAEEPFKRCIEAIDDISEKDSQVILDKIQECIRDHIKVSFESSCEFLYEVRGSDSKEDQVDLEILEKRIGTPMVFLGEMILGMIYEALDSFGSSRVEMQAKMTGVQIASILMEYDMWDPVDTTDIYVDMYVDMAIKSAVRAFLLISGAVPIYFLTSGVSYKESFIIYNASDDDPCQYTNASGSSFMSYK